jgi:membrane protease subunit HflC
MKGKVVTICAIILLLLGLLLFLVTFQVRVDQVAMVERLGQVVRIIRPSLGVSGESTAEYEMVKDREVPVVREAGWFFKVPLLYKEKVFDQRIRSVDGRVVQIQLSDGNQVIPRAYATWRIVNPVQFGSTLEGSFAEAEDTLKQKIGAAMQLAFGKRVLSEIVNVSEADLHYDEIENEIFQIAKQSIELGDEAKGGYGIELCSLGISWVALPEQATAAVFDRMNQERTTEAERLLEEGRKIKRTLIAEAQEKSAEILANAEAGARSLRAQGEAEAADSYKAFAANQDLAIFLRNLESLRKLARTAAENGQPITFVLSTQGYPFRLLEGGPMEEYVKPTKPTDLALPQPMGETPAAGGE